MHTNQTILNKLENRNLPTEVRNKILPILRENMNRIQFVKNFVGLKDVLYFEELTMNLSDFPIFVSLNCPIKEAGNDKYELITAVYENATTDTEEIVRKLELFFDDTNRTLFVDVAFEENLLTNDDMWEIFHEMENELEKEPFELMVRKYRYPEWYQAEFGDRISILENSLEMLHVINNHQITQKIKQLEEDINHVLENGTMEEFRSLVSELKQLKSLSENLE